MPCDSETDSQLTGEMFEDVFREAFTKFIKKNADPCKTESQIIKNGEARWRRLPKYKKVEYLQKALKARKRRQQKSNKRPCCSVRRHTFSGVPRDEDGTWVADALLEEISEQYGPKARAVKRYGRKKRKS